MKDLWYTLPIFYAISVLQSNCETKVEPIIANGYRGIFSKTDAMKVLAGIMSVRYIKM
ncbi:MAG: hypothetical protein Q8942_10140 [Bacillota bacterium]|nr:hypothetical protein [Bacillota bacterium]